MVEIEVVLIEIEITVEAVINIVFLRYKLKNPVLTKTGFFYSGFPKVLNKFKKAVK